MTIRDNKQIMLVCKIFGIIGGGLMVLGSFLIYKLYDLDPSNITCRVNEEIVDCPEHIGAVFGAIPAFIGLVFFIVAFVLYIKNRDHQMDGM